MGFRIVFLLFSSLLPTLAAIGGHYINVPEILDLGGCTANYLDAVNKLPETQLATFQQLSNLSYEVEFGGPYDKWGRLTNIHQFSEPCAKSSLAAVLTGVLDSVITRNPTVAYLHILCKYAAVRSHFSQDRRRYAVVQAQAAWNVSRLGTKEGIPASSLSNLAMTIHYLNENHLCHELLDRDMIRYEPGRMAQLLTLHCTVTPDA